MAESLDPLSLLRLSNVGDGYPNEPSDEQVAEAAGVDVAQVVRFDLNTLGGGPLPGVTAALREYDPAAVVEYGDPSYARLRAALGAAIGVAPGRIVPGAGADELIRLVTGMLVGPGDAVVVPTPTFPMFAVEATLAGATVIGVPREHPGVRQPVRRIREEAEDRGARLIWLCSPNNPTGDAYDRDEVRALTAGLRAVVVVDAVYQEFAEASGRVPPESTSLIPLQDELPNLLVLRSFAKAYGLAGARVGYLVVPDALAGRFDVARLPLSVGGPSQAAALGALADRSAARHRQQEIVAERARMATALQASGWEVLPSVTNFILVRPTAGVQPAELATTLAASGLVLRSFPADGPLGAWLRITARSAAENDRLLVALEALAAAG